jgi:hypothetical protein
MMKKIGIALLTILMTTHGFVFADDKNAVTSSIDQITFTNELFDLSIKKPKTWVALTTAELFALQRKGSSLLARDDKELKAALDKAMETTLPLFTFLSLPLGTKGKQNINVMAVAENIKSDPPTITACDYLEDVKALISKTESKITVSKKCQKIDTGNAKLSYFDLKMESNGSIVYQRFSACKKNFYMLSIVQVFLDEDGRQETTDIVNTLKVKCDPD